MMIDIIGGGIGGLTCGIALKRKGFKVRVFEQAKEMKPVGAGIILASNAMQVYRELGLSQKITNKGCTVSSLSVVDKKFQLISKTDLSVFEETFQLKNVAIHRGVLQQVLIEEFKTDELFLDHKLDEIRTEKNACVLRFENGKEYKSFLTIGADGIYSKVRNTLFDNVPIRKANQMCWRGVLNYPLSDRFKNQAIESWGKGKRFGFVKIDKNQVYWFALKSIKEESAKENETLDATLFSDFDPLVVDMIVKTEKNKIHAGEIVDLKPFKSWSISNVCLLGDAAHATTPNLGQGACQAIEDAFVLAECLEKYEYEKAFTEFEKLRVYKAHKIVKTSYMLGKIAHWSNRILIVLRNGMLRNLPASINKKQIESLFLLDKI